MVIAFRIGLVVISSLFILFVVSLWATSTGQRRYISVVHEAIDDGTLAKTTLLPLAPGVRLHEYNFNDCVILSMLVLAPRGTVLQRAISPLVPISDGLSKGELPIAFPPYVQCQNLLNSLNDPTVPSNYHHRYLYGHWVLAAALLRVLSFRSATSLLLITLCGMLAAIAISAARSAWVGPAATRNRHLAFLSIPVVLALFYALPAFDRSLSFAPSDIILVGFVLFAYLSPLSRLTEAQYVMVTAAFGSLTAIFEFLIGAIPSGAAILFAMLVLDPSSDRALLHRRAFLGLFCFLSAIALSFVGKAIAVAAIWGGSEIASASAHLGRYLGNSWDIAAENEAKLRAFGISPGTIKASRGLSTLLALAKVVYFSPLVGLGSRLLGITIVVVLPVLLAARCCIFLRRASDDERSRDIIALSAAAMMPLWYVVFATHTIIHAHFMVRPMVWTLAILAAREMWRIEKLARRPTPQAS